MTSGGAATAASPFTHSRTMNRLLLAALAATAIFGLVGCGVGNVPRGMDENDAKSAIDKMTPEQKNGLSHRARAIANLVEALGGPWGDDTPARS